MEQAFLQPGGRLEEVVMEDWIVDRLTPKLPSMEHTSHAVFSPVETDIPGHKDTLLKCFVHALIVLPCLLMFTTSCFRMHIFSGEWPLHSNILKPSLRFVNTFHSVPLQNPKAILVGGTPEIIERGKSQLSAFQKQVTAAPLGGLIFIVPQDEISRMQLVERLIPDLQKELQAQISHIYRGRIQITGSNQPEVVARLLKWMNNKGSVLLLGFAMEPLFTFLFLLCKFFV